MSSSGTVRRSQLPTVLALLVFGIATAASVESALSRCDGHLVYAVDDAYIHLAMARTIVESGTWGIWPGQSAFASSSPGWTLLLALLRVGGVRSVWTPLVLNVLAGALLLAGLDVAARRLLVTDRARSWLLVAAVFVTPMPALVLLGMETLAHAAAVVWLVGVVARLNDRPARGVDGVLGVGPSGSGLRGPTPKARPPAPVLSSNAPRLISVGALSAISVALRYESLFVVTARRRTTPRTRPPRTRRRRGSRRGPAGRRIRNLLVGPRRTLAS